MTTAYPAAPSLSATLPFPEPEETLAPEGGHYRQLAEDLRRLELHITAGYSFDMLDIAVRHRIRVQFPQYLFWATLQRVAAAAAEAGIPDTPDDRPRAFDWWTDRYGDPWFALRARMDWLALVAGAVRVP